MSEQTRLFLRLTLWQNGAAIYWPAADVGPIVDLGEEEARRAYDQRGNGRATSVQSLHRDTDFRLVRETPEEIVRMLGGEVVWPPARHLAALRETETGIGTPIGLVLAGEDSCGACAIGLPHDPASCVELTP